MGCETQAKACRETRLFTRLGRQRGNPPGPWRLGFASLRRVKPFYRPRSDPTRLSHTRTAGCRLSAPDRRFATPLPHNPDEQIGWCLPPLRRPARVRTLPSPLDVDDGSPPSLLFHLPAPLREP